MTCDHFRYLNGMAERMLETTRAERAVAARHFCNCPDCRRWVSVLPEIPLPLGITLQQIQQIKFDDMVDPEYLEVARGKEL